MMDMGTYTFGTCYFSVALLLKPRSAALKLEVQNNVCARDPPMYSEGISGHILDTQSMHEPMMQNVILVG